MDYGRLRELLSAERLGSYLEAADGDLKRAFALYDWNIEASAAALSLAAMVEVVVRNALAAQAQACARSRGGGDWLTSAPLDDTVAASHSSFCAVGWDVFVPEPIHRIWP